MSGQCRFARLDASGETLWYCLGLDKTPHKHRHTKEAVQKVRTTGKWLNMARNEQGGGA